MDKKFSKKILIGGVILVITVGVVGISISVMDQSQLESEGICYMPKSNEIELLSSQPAALKYKDGFYTAMGSYITPDGSESINVGVTLEGGVVKDLSFTGESLSKTSQQHQRLFKEGIDKYIVGKSIDTDLSNVRRVNCSSLTIGGFRKALDIIKDSAADGSQI